MAVLLRLNGQVLEADRAEAALVFLPFAAGDLQQAELADWLRNNASPPEWRVPDAGAGSVDPVSPPG
jgi:prophage maintenance system killer protein